MCLGWSNVELPQNAWKATGAIEVLNVERAPEETYLWGIPILLAVWTSLVAQVLIKKLYLYAQQRARAPTLPHLCSCCAQLPSFPYSLLPWSTRCIHGTQPGANVLTGCASAAQVLDLSQGSTPGINLGVTVTIAADPCVHTDAADGSLPPVAIMTGPAQPHNTTDSDQPSTPVACSRGTQAAASTQGPASTTALTVLQAADLAAARLHATIQSEQLPTREQQQAQHEFRTLNAWTYQPVHSTRTWRQQTPRRRYVILDPCLMDFGLWCVTNGLTLPEHPQRTYVRQRARWWPAWCLPAARLVRQLQAVGLHQDNTTSTNSAVLAHLAQPHSGGLRGNSITAGSSQQLLPATGASLPDAQLAVFTVQPSLLQVQATPLKVAKSQVMMRMPAARPKFATLVVSQQFGSCRPLAAFTVPSTRQQVDVVFIDYAAAQQAAMASTRQQVDVLFIDCAAAQQAAKAAQIACLRAKYKWSCPRAINASRAVFQQLSGHIRLAALAVPRTQQQVYVLFIDCAAAQLANTADIAYLRAKYNLRRPHASNASRAFFQQLSSPVRLAAVSSTRQQVDVLFIDCAAAQLANTADIAYHRAKYNLRRTRASNASRAFFQQLSSPIRLAAVPSTRQQVDVLFIDCAAAQQAAKAAQIACLRAKYKWSCPRAINASRAVFQQLSGPIRVAALAVPRTQQQVYVLFIECAAAQLANTADIAYLRAKYNLRRPHASNASRAFFQQLSCPIRLAAVPSTRQQVDVLFIDCAAAQQAAKAAQIPCLRAKYKWSCPRAINASRAVFQQLSGPIRLAALAVPRTRQQVYVLFIDCAAAQLANTADIAYHRAKYNLRRPHASNASRAFFQQLSSPVRLAAVSSTRQQVDVLFIDCAAAQLANTADIAYHRAKYNLRRPHASNASRAFFQQLSCPIRLAAVPSTRQQVDVLFIDCAAAQQAAKAAQTCKAELPGAGPAPKPASPKQPAASSFLLTSAPQPLHTTPTLSCGSSKLRSHCDAAQPCPGSRVAPCKSNAAGRPLAPAAGKRLLVEETNSPEAGDQPGPVTTSGRRHVKAVRRNKQLVTGHMHCNVNQASAAIGTSAGQHSSALNSRTVPDVSEQHSSGDEEEETKWEEWQQLLDVYESEPEEEHEGEEQSNTMRQLLGHLYDSDPEDSPKNQVPKQSSQPAACRASHTSDLDVTCKLSSHGTTLARGVVKRSLDDDYDSSQDGDQPASAPARNRRRVKTLRHSKGRVTGHAHYSQTAASISADAGQQTVTAVSTTSKAGAGQAAEHTVGDGAPCHSDTNALVAHGSSTKGDDQVGVQPKPSIKARIKISSSLAKKFAALNCQPSSLTPAGSDTLPLLGHDSNAPCAGQLQSPSAQVLFQQHVAGVGVATSCSNTPPAKGNSPASSSHMGRLQHRRQGPGGLTTTSGNSSSAMGCTQGQSWPVIPPSPGGFKPDALLTTKDAQDLMGQSKLASRISSQAYQGSHSFKAPADKVAGAVINNAFIASVPACFSGGITDKPAGAQIKAKQSRPGRKGRMPVQASAM